MRRIIGFLFPVFVVCGGAWFWYDHNYGTTDYYTKIVQEGKRVDIGSGGGMDQYRYSYHLLVIRKRIMRKHSLLTLPRIKS